MTTIHPNPDPLDSLAWAKRMLEAGILGDLGPFIEDDDNSDERPVRPTRLA